MRQVVYYRFQCFVYMYHAVLFKFRPGLPVLCPVSITYSSHRLFSNIGLTYQAAFLLSVIQQMQVRIDGNKRIYIYIWINGLLVRNPI